MLQHELRYAARMILKRPAFTLVAMLTLALGIGANTAIFSVTNALILRPFDFPDLDRLVVIFGTMPQGGSGLFLFAPADLSDLRRQQKSFADLAAYRQSNSNLTGAGEPERVQRYEVSSNFFPLLGGEAALGRTFLPEEEQPGRAQAAILSHALWQRRFGADPAVVGRTIALDEQPYTIVGVMKEGFDFPKPVELWTPLALSAEGWQQRQERSLEVVARLAESVEVSEANAEVEMLMKRLAEQYPQTNTGRSATVRLLRRNVNGEYNEVFMGLLSAAVAFVLLIACVNLASMQLASGSARSREMAVRVALGAGRGALIRQLLTESLLLALLGGVSGLLVSFWLLDFIRDSIPLDQVRYVSGWEKIRLDERVMLFNLLISLLSGVIFGLVPALQASRPNLNEALKDGGRGQSGGRQRLRQALIVAEVALALALLVGSGLMVKGFARLLEKQQQGFDPNGVLTLRTTLPPSRYEDHQVAAFYRLAEERLAALPGIESVSTSDFIPGSDSWNTTAFQIEGEEPPQPGQERVITYQKTSAGFFRTLRIPIVKGRAFATSDAEGAPRVAIISEAAARRYFPGVDPLGRRVKIGGSSSTAPLYTIVGVTGDTSRFMFDREIEPMIYVPNQQLPDRGAYLLLRTTGEPMAAAAAVRAQLAALDDKLPLYEIKSHTQVIADDLAGLRLAAALMAMFGAVALGLAAVGVYGVMAYAVSQRTQEIGVRMALGARPRDVLLMIIRQGLKLAALGLAVGLPLALALGRVMAGALFGVVALDVMTFIAFALLLAGAALLASYVPARRAMRVDPLVALRYE